MIFDGDKDESRLQSLKMDPGYEDVDKYIDTSQYSDTRQTNPINIYHTTHPLATLKRTDKSNSNVTSSKNDKIDLKTIKYRLKYFKNFFSFKIIFIKNFIK